MKKKCVIFGASSSLAQYLKYQFKEKGWKVICYSSQKNSKNYFNLNTPHNTNFLHTISANLIINCSYDFKQLKWNNIYKTNVIGSLILFKKLRSYSKGTIVNISTLSSFDHCKSNYGRAKYLIEKYSKRFRIIHIRCGLFNNQNSKLFNKLNWISNNLKVCPMFGDGKFNIHICNYKYLLEEILECYNKKSHNLILFSGSKEKYFFKDIVYFLSGKKIFFIYVPLIFIKIFLKLLNFTNINLGFSYDNLLGLINYNNKIKIPFKSKHRLN